MHLCIRPCSVSPVFCVTAGSSQIFSWFINFFMTLWIRSEGSRRLLMEESWFSVSMIRATYLLRSQLM